MFSPRNPVMAYRRVGLESDVASANPHRLVHLLYDGALQSVRTARSQMESGQLAAKGMAISKAIRIVDEGLKASLDPARGGDLAARLAALYDYIERRLLDAGSLNDPRALEEVEGLLATLRDAWAAIEPEPPAPVPATRGSYGALAAA